jgi:hypothetical protein
MESTILTLIGLCATPFLSTSTIMFPRWSGSFESYGWAGPPFLHPNAKETTAKSQTNPN